MAAFDDLGRSRSTVYYDEFGRPRLSKDPPSFCAPITEDEINRAHEAIKDGRWEDPVFAWNPGRHKDAKNPTQCESQRRYDLATDRWYREPAGSLLKNIGAGIVNAIVPGSDLGDAGSSTQILGTVIGSIVGSVVNPLGVVGNAISKTVNLGAIGNAVFGAVKTAFNLSTTPLGSLVTGVVGQAISPVKTGIAAPAATVATAGQVPFTTAIPFLSTSKASTAAFEDPNKKTGLASVPVWGWILIAFVPLGLLFYLVFKRK